MKNATNLIFIHQLATQSALLKHTYVGQFWPAGSLLPTTGVGYKKIAKTLKLSCSTVAKTIQRFNGTGSTQNRPRHGRPKKLSACAQRHIQRLCLGNRHMSAASIAAEVEGVGGQSVSPQTIGRTLHQIGLHGCRPRKKPLLKMMHKKAHKQFAEDKQTKVMDYWNHVLWSGETYGVQMVSSVCGGNQVRSTKTSVSCLQSSIVVGVSCSGAAWVPSMSSDPNPIEHLWGILKRKVEERKVSNIHQLRDVVMEWKMTPVATCESLVNSMPKRVKAVLENNGGHTKYWHFGPNFDIFI